MSSSWATKFEKKLKALTEGGASKESIQTLATWMVFNRKHVSAFSQVLLSLPDLTSAEATVAVAVGVPNTTATTSKQTLYWQLIHQVLLSNKEDQDKWERALDMRITMGESVILVALPNLCSNNNNNDDDETSTTATIMDLVEGMIKEWDQCNVFGGPTLTGQIKRILLTAKSTMATPALTTTTTTTTADVSPKVAESAAASASAVVKAEQVETTVPPTAKSSPVGIERSSSPPLSSSPQQPQPPPPSSPGGKQQPQNHQRRESMSSVHSEQPTAPFEYNFDNSEIPLGIVEPKEFLDPCKAVATLQIARDIRHDTPVLLHGLLSNLPKDIQDYVSALFQQQQLQQQQDTNSDESSLPVVTPVEELEDSTIQDYSRRIPTELLEMDWSEQFQTIQTFQDIIRRQRQARQKLIYLLIKSRCQLGSQEAAQLFHQLDTTTMKALKKKKQLLIDALELEGMDSVVLEDKAQEKLLEESLSDLAPLAWYNPKDDDQDATSTAKRQKVE